MIERTISHYRILKKLGAGGMGEVYLAEDTKLDRRVALKLLPREHTLNEERLRRFKQEAKAASALNHPNILTIHEVGELDGQHFIATEFIDGETLSRSLKRQGRIKTSEALDVAAQVAAALAAAHEAGIVHRDIKPENIMLRRDALVKVLDFGLAKLTETAAPQSVDTSAQTKPFAAHTETGLVIGTAPYMSPEQARGLTVDARTDIWSLGCVLYEMLAGRAPFEGETVTDILVSIVEKDPPPINSLTTEKIPDELNWIINKTLRKDKDERSQTSKELLIDLRRLKERLEFEARLERSTPPEAGGKTAKREAWLRKVFSTRRASMFAGILLALVTAVVLASLWRWGQAPVPQPEIKSLAVLPLRSLDTNDNYLGFGIADAVIRRISQTGKLIVRPASAVRRYLNEETNALVAARQLEVDAVLEGNVQRAEDRLRVSVNLLRVADGASLWAHSFDTRAADIFTIQDAVSEQIASRLRLQLDPAQQERLTRHYTSNPGAYEYLLKGSYNLDKVGLVRTPELDVAIEMFKKAIELDPQYALAHARLASCYMRIALFIDTENPVWIERAREELRKAEMLDPNLAEASAVRYDIIYSRFGGFDIRGTIRELHRAQQLDPNFGHVNLGWICAHLGFQDLSLAKLQRAIEIDPTSESPKSYLIESYELLYMPDESIAASRRFFNDQGRVLSLLWKNRLSEAEEKIGRLLAKAPDDVRTQSERVRLLTLQGRFDEAEALIPGISERSRNNRAYHHISYEFACAYALEGKAREAVEWLRKTVDYGMPNYPLFERDPHLDRIRHEPAFIQFMQELRPRWEEHKSEFT